MKVLFVLPTLHAGGAENYLLRFVRHSQGLYDAWVMSIREERGDLHDEFEKTGVKLLYQSVGYLNLFKILKIIRLIQKERYDVVCTFNGNFGGLVLCCAKLAGVRKRIGLYRRSTPAFSPSFLKMLYHKAMGGLLLYAATDILSNSRFAFENFFPSLYSRDRRFRIIPNGVPTFCCNANKTVLRKKFGIPTNRFIIGHVGRVDPAKNHSMIFRTLRSLIDANRFVYVVFCGKGTDSGAFQSELDTWGISESSVGLGLQDSIGDVLGCLDLFFFPSVTEGQPNALIEAMLAGVPVLASDIPSIKESVPETFYDRLIDPHDVEKAVSVISLLMDSEAERASYRLERFARSYYDPHLRFKEFQTVIGGKLMQLRLNR